MAEAFKFDNTLGALFVGFGVSAVLYGMFLSQVYGYFCRYPSDKLGYKALVAVLFLLQSTHQAFIGHSVYYYSVTNYLNVIALFGKPIWSLVFQLPLGSLIGTIVKFFFTLRVWRFSYGNIWLTAYLLLLTFGQLGLALFYTAKSYILPELPDLVSLRVIGIVALGISVLNDVSITVALCYYLQAMRSGYTHTNSVIRTLTLYAVSTGLLTSAMGFSTLIVYNCMPQNLVFVGCYFVMSTLYAVSFVAALNTRQPTQGQSVDSGSKKVSVFQITSSQKTGTHGIPLQAPPSTRGTWTTESHNDEEHGTSLTRAFSEEWMAQNSPHYVAGW